LNTFTSSPPLVVARDEKLRVAPPPRTGLSSSLGLADSPTVSTLVPNENPEKIFGLAAELSVDFSSGLSLVSSFLIVGVVEKVNPPKVVPVVP